MARNLKSLDPVALIKDRKVLPDASKELIKLSEQIIAGSLLLGYKHAVIQKTDHDFADIEVTAGLEPIPFEEATDFIKGKVSITKEEWEELEPKLRFRAFTVARLAEADHIEVVRRSLIRAMEEEGKTMAETWDEFKALAEDAASTGSLKGKGFLPGYFETVYRTNIQSAYSAGRLMQYKDDMPPAWELLIIEDRRTSDTCKGIVSMIGNGKALPSNHPFWKRYGFPPYHFNCRTGFRAVYDYEIGHGTTVVNPPMRRLRRKLKVQKGFGGNPLEKESWWKITDGMKRKITRYGIAKEVEKLAHDLGMKNYEVKFASSRIEKRPLAGSAFKANAIKRSSPKPHEIEIAKILEENGHKVLFTPENHRKGVKNPEGLLLDKDKIVEMKKVESAKLDRVEERVIEASQQNAEIAVLHLKGEKEYTKNSAINKVKEVMKNDENILKEVWIIWKGKISKIKK